MWKLVHSSDVLLGPDSVGLGGGPQLALWKHPVFSSASDMKPTLEESPWRRLLSSKCLLLGVWPMDQTTSPSPGSLLGIQNVATLQIYWIKTCIFYKMPSCSHVQHESTSKWQDQLETSFSLVTGSQVAVRIEVVRFVVADTFNLT
jgi:hypothetical protein